MATSPVSIPGNIARRQLRTLPLVALIYFSVSGGPYGLETAISSSGPGMTMLMLIVIPLIFSIPCALMNAELGSAIPLQGGYYNWVKIGMGRFWGFMEGASSWIASWLDTALYPVLFIDYLAVWFPALERGNHSVFSLWDGAFSLDLHWLTAIAFMIPLGYLNARGSTSVGNTSIGLFVVIIAPFIVVTVLGFIHLANTPGMNPLEPFSLPDMSKMQAAGAGLGVIIWNYIGFDAVSTVGGETEKPYRTYPLALLVSVPLIMVTYLFPVFASLSSGLHAGEVGLWDNGDFALVGEALGGPWLKGAIVVGALLSQVGLFSSLLMSGSRVPAVLAADHYLPESFAEINPRTGTPVKSIILSCGIFSVFTALNFSTLINADIMLNMFSISLEFLALIALRRKYPNMVRPFKVPGGMPGAVAISVFPIALCVWIIQSAWVEEPVSFWIGIVMLGGSAALYPVLNRYVKRGRPDFVHTSDTIDFGPGIDTASILAGTAR